VIFESIKSNDQGGTLFFASDRLKFKESVILAAAEANIVSFLYAPIAFQRNNEFLYEVWERTKFKPLLRNNPIYDFSTEETQKGSITIRII
jgi:hypothetical protein